MREFLKTWFHRLVMVLLMFIGGVTTRKVWINRHILEIFREQGQNFILGTWHNNIIVFTHVYGRMKVRVLVSRSRDGENATWASARFGIVTVRGSSTRGSVGGLRELLRLLANGGLVAITPDGPRGPRYVLQPGIVTTAQLSGKPIVPMAYAGPRMIEINSWDRAKLPWPFSKVFIYVGEPVWIARDEPDLEAARVRVEQAIRKAEAVAERFAGGPRVEREPLLAAALGPPPRSPREG